MQKTPEKTAEFVNALDDLSGRVDALEEVVYGGPEDNICPDCRFDMLMDSLEDLDTEQLMRVHAEASQLLEERSQESMNRVINTAKKGTSHPVMVDVPPPAARKATIDTKDGLLSDFVEYCKEHPELRLGQAFTSFTGYGKVWGEDHNEELHDLWQWNGPEKGPKE